MSSTNTSKLLGKWITDPEDTRSIKEFGHVALEFREDGSFIYTLQGKKKEQKMFLTYREENGILITDQPSHPREERTAFFLTGDDRLVLKYGDMNRLTSDY